MHLVVKYHLPKIIPTTAKLDDHGRRWKKCDVFFENIQKKYFISNSIKLYI